MPMPFSFKTPALNQLANILRASSRGEEHCLISRMSVDETNSVRLPCNHVYHIDYYSASVRKRHRCPYCALVYAPEDLERPCSECGQVTPIQNGKCKKHNQPRCSFIIKKGKNKGKECGLRAGTGFSVCARHKASSDLEGSGVLSTNESVG